MESINGTIMVSIVLSPYGPEPPVESRWTALVIRCPGRRIVGVSRWWSSSCRISRREASIVVLESVARS